MTALQFPARLFVNWVVRPSDEYRRGVILLAWALAVGRIPHLNDFSGYSTLGRILHWTGEPKTALMLTGLMIGPAIIAADVCRIDPLRRLAAIAAVSFWLLVASGFLTHAAPPAAIIYLGMAWSNLRTAMGRRPK